MTNRRKTILVIALSASGLLVVGVVLSLITILVDYAKPSHPFFLEPAFECRTARDWQDKYTASSSLTQHDGIVDVVARAPTGFVDPAPGVEIGIQVMDRSIIVSRDWNYHISVCTKCDGNKVTLATDMGDPIFFSGFVGVFDTQWTATQLDDGGLRVKLLVTFHDSKNRRDHVSKEIVLEIRRLTEG